MCVARQNNRLCTEPFSRARAWNFRLNKHTSGKSTSHWDQSYIYIYMCTQFALYMRPPKQIHFRALVNESQTRATRASWGWCRNCVWQDVTRCLGLALLGFCDLQYNINIRVRDSEYIYEYIYTLCAALKLNFSTKRAPHHFRERTRASLFANTKRPRAFGRRSKRFP